MGALGLLHLAAGAALAAGAWLLPRHVAGSGKGPIGGLLLDIAPLGLGAALLAFAWGRPLFAGLIILALGAGFTLADHTMRRTLREPTVFSEMSELPQVFTHPQLYLPFAGPGLVLGGAGAAVLGAMALFVVEPPLWTPHPVAAIVATALILAAGWLLAYEPLLGANARLMRGLRPSGEPFADAARLGPFGMIIVHAVIARSERRGRSQALRPEPGRARVARSDPAPVILVQCESFFDARRISPQIPTGVLASYDAACAGAECWGRVGVPGWGANTMRTEFAVLSGIPESELGYDRFNPYYALARRPVASQVWRLRHAGYRTICLHPFDPRFFRRDLAMPALGFERFLAGNDLAASRRPPYLPDPALAELILEHFDAAGPASFIFAITMGNHGPWMAKGPPIDRAISAIAGAAEVPDNGELLRYLDGLKRSDEMLQILLDGFERRGLPAVLGFYGDHLPSLTTAFGHFSFEETASDYVIRAPGDAAAQRRDLPAHEIGRLVADLALGAQPADSPGACLPLRQAASFDA